MAFNRTRLELKYNGYLYAENRDGAFNRTRLELKFIG